MAKNFPGPYEIEMFYTVNGVQHTQRLNCAVFAAPVPGTPIGNIDLDTRGGILSPDIPTAMAAWVALIDEQFNIGATFDNYNLWNYTALSTERKFISAGTLGLSGTSGSATNENQQDTYTFRTIDGDGLRVVLLDTVQTSEVRTAYAALGVGQQNIMDFIDSDANWILARDTSYAIAKLNAVGGQNEALFKRRNR